MQEFPHLRSGGDEGIEEAIVSRNWCVYRYLCKNSTILNINNEQLDAALPPKSQKDQTENEEEEFDSMKVVEKIQENVNQKENEKDKVNTWLNRM